MKCPYRKIKIKRVDEKYNSIFEEEYNECLYNYCPFYKGLLSGHVCRRAEAEVNSGQKNS